MRNTQRVSPYYAPDPQNGIIVREFFSKLADAEQARGSRREIQLTAQKIKDWPITVHTTLAHAPMNFYLNHRARILVVALVLLALGSLTRRFWMAWLPRKHRQLRRT